MATETDGGQVETAPVPSTPATAPAAPAPAESSAVETLSSSPSDTLAEALAEFQLHYDTPTTAAGNEEKTQEPAPAPAGEQPASEAQPNGEQPAEVKTPPEEPTPEGELPKQVRPRISDPDDLAILQIQRAKGLASFGEAAKLYYGLGQPAAPKEGAIPGMESAPAAPAAPPPSQAIQAQVDALAAEIKAERESDGYLTPEHLEKADRLADLKSDLKVARFQESMDARARQQAEVQAEAQEAGKAISGSTAAAIKEYPTISTPDSPLNKASGTVIAEWSADPAKQARLTAPNAPQLVAAEAAYRTAQAAFSAGKFATLDLALASLKSAPPAPAATAAKAPAPLSSPVPTPQPQPSRRVTAAAGSKGQARDDQPSSLNAAMAAVTTAQEGNELLKQLYGTGPFAL